MNELEIKFYVVKIYAFNLYNMIRRGREEYLDNDKKISNKSKLTLSRLTLLWEGCQSRSHISLILGKAFTDTEVLIPSCD